MGRCIFREEMGLIQRLAVCCERAPFAVVLALAGLCASLVICSEDSVRSVSKGGMRITTATPFRGPMKALVEDDDRESQKFDLEPCGLPGVSLDSVRSVAFSQVPPTQSAHLSLLTSAALPLRC